METDNRRSRTFHHRKYHLLLLSLALFLLITLSACNGNIGYNETIYEIKSDSFNDDFLNNNKVRDALYDGIVSTDNESLPKQRTFIINNEADYNSIFAASAQNVDFDSETIIVYTYTAINIRRVSISKVTKSDNSLKVELKEEKVNAGVLDTTVPYQRFIVIKLSNVDISDIEISWI